MSQFFRPVACIVDLETGFEFFERNSQALRQTDLPFAQLIPGGYLEFMDGPEHTVYRTAFRDAIKATLNESAGMMACATRAFFDSLAEASAAGEIDPAPELDRFAFTNLLQIVLGIEADDPRFERLVDGYTTLDYQLGLGRALPPQLRESYDRLSSEVREILAVEAKYPDDATKPRPASIARSLVAEQGLLPDDETVIGNLIFMVQIGSNNLGGFLLWVLELTSRHPQCLDLLRSLPPGASHESSDIETAIVHEVLRLRQSEYVYRIAQSDLVLDQFVIPKGWMIRLCLRECHRRADIYDEPSAFLPQRMLDGSVLSAAFAPFSRGAHSCVAIALVTKVARIFVRQLADGFDCQASATGPVERGDRHWNHWRPSSNFRIRINHRHGTGVDTAMGNST